LSDFELDGYEPDAAELEAVLAWAGQYPEYQLQTYGDDWLDEQLRPYVDDDDEWPASGTAGTTITFTMPRRARARAPRGRHVTRTRTAARGSPRRSDDPELVAAGGVR
jgi:hypothetical protein